MTVELWEGMEECTINPKVVNTITTITLSNTKGVLMVHI